MRLDKKSFKATSPEPLIQIQTNFTLMFLMMPFTKGKLSSAEQICNQNYPVKTELSLNNISFATDHNRISCARVHGSNPHL